MALEFDCEVALFQTAINAIYKKYGDGDYYNTQISLDVIMNSYQDICTIREEDGLSLQQIEHKNRKLVTGLICVVLRDKLDFWEPGECFVAVNEVYPPFGWGFFLEIIKAFQWSDYFFECLIAINPATLKQELDDILCHLSNPDCSSDVTVLGRILMMLNHTISSKIVPDVHGILDENHHTQTCNMLIQRVPNHKTWPSSVLHDYYVCVFGSLTDICCALLNSDNSDSIKHKSHPNVSSNLTLETIEDRYHECFVKENEKQSEMNSDEPASINTQSLIKYLDLCYESLIVLEGREISQLLNFSRVPSNFLLKMYGGLTDLTVCFMVLNRLCKDVIVRFSADSQKFVNLFQLILQRIDAISTGLSRIKPKSCENIISIIDGRNKHYEDSLDYLTKSPALFNQVDCLECLKRNAGLLNKKQAHCLLRHIAKAEELNLLAVDTLQEVIFSAFAAWPWALQQQFQYECLSMYKENSLLHTNQFEEELMTTFNKIVCADAKINKNLSLQMGRLCLQSTRKTLEQVVFQAMNSKAQGDVLVQLLKSVSCCCGFRSSPKDLSILCDVLNEMLLNYCLTEMQFQNLKAFMKKLLKTKHDGNVQKILQLHLPWLTYQELMQSCILPYLNQWNPGHGCRLTLYAVQLLHMMLNSESVTKTCSWLHQFKPVVLLCYLGLILAQCKIIHRNCEVDWVGMKLQTVTTLNKLLSLIASCPTLVKKAEINWLCKKLQASDENTVFYFLDLCDEFDIDLTKLKSEDTVVSVLELALCKDSNVEIAKSAFENLIEKVGPLADTQLTAALEKVLPFSLLDEWKRIANLLAHVLQKSDLFEYSPSLSTVLPKDGKIVCRQANLLLSVIYSLSIAGFNVQYMMQCFCAIMKDKLCFLKECFASDEELSGTIIELFVQVCHVMKTLTEKSSEEGYLLLMELSQMVPDHPSNLSESVMTSVVKNINESAFQYNLLKALS